MNDIGVEEAFFEMGEAAPRADDERRTGPMKEVERRSNEILKQTTNTELRRKKDESETIQGSKA